MSTTIALTEQTKDALESLKDERGITNMNGVVRELLRDSEQLVSVKEDLEEATSEVERLEKYDPDDKQVDRTFDRLGLDHSTPLPDGVAEAIVGRVGNRSNPRFGRLFFGSEWVLNANFASSPEFVDIFPAANGAVLAYHGMVLNGIDWMYFYIPRENYDAELQNLLQDSEPPVFLPPGGLDVEMIDMGGADHKRPYRNIEYGGGSRWPIVGYGLDMESSEDVDRLLDRHDILWAMVASTIPERINYEERMDNMGDDKIFAGIHVDEPEKSLNAFINWAGRRADWVPQAYEATDGDYEGVAEWLREQKDLAMDELMEEFAGELNGNTDA